MAEIFDFELSKEDLLALAEKCLSEGSAERSIAYLKQALALDERYSDASVQLAAIYSGLGAFQISNVILYKALVSVPSESELESRIFYHLANNFIELGDAEVASYYMRYFGEDYTVDISDVEEGETAFRVSYPRGEDYYEMLIERAYREIKARNFDAAIDAVKDVDPRSKTAEAANHIVLVCYMMKNDVDRVIDEAERMLKKADSLAVRSTLATAYMMEERLPEAYAVVDGILEKEYTRLEEVLLILPLLVNLKLHVQVVKYTKQVLDSLNLQPNTMIWLSQGLYNLGQKNEAEKIMNRVKNIYGEYSPAEYFLDLYKTNPPEVEYNMNLPYDERMRRYKRLDEFVKMGKADFEKQLKKGTELTELIRWAFLDGNEKVESMIMNRLSFSQTEWVRTFYREVLLAPELSFDIMSSILAGLLNNGFTLECAVVTQDRFKDVFLTLPDAYYMLPRIFKDAVGYAICDIIFTDEDPTTYLDRLCKEINELVWLGADGKLIWKNKTVEKVSRFKSMATLVGVLLSRAYFDDPDPKEDNMERYGLSARTFDKYYKIVFGDEDGFGGDNEE